MTILTTLQKSKVKELKQAVENDQLDQANRICDEIELLGLPDQILENIQDIVDAYEHYFDKNIHDYDLNSAIKRLEEICNLPTK